MLLGIPLLLSIQRRAAFFSRLQCTTKLLIEKVSPFYVPKKDNPDHVHPQLPILHAVVMNPLSCPRVYWIPDHPQNYPSSMLLSRIPCPVPVSAGPQTTPCFGRLFQAAWPHASLAPSYPWIVPLGLGTSLLITPSIVFSPSSAGLSAAHATLTSPPHSCLVPVLHRSSSATADTYFCPFSPLSFSITSFLKKECWSLYLLFTTDAPVTTEYHIIQSPPYAGQE